MAGGGVSFSNIYIKTQGYSYMKELCITSDVEAEKHAIYCDIEKV